jgi:hypothetical protein
MIDTDTEQTWSNSTNLTSPLSIYCCLAFLSSLLNKKLEGLFARFFLIVLSPDRLPLPGGPKKFSLEDSEKIF